MSSPNNFQTNLGQTTNMSNPVIMYIIELLINKLILSHRKSSRKYQVNPNLQGREGAEGHPSWYFSGHISQTVYSSLTKLSDIFCLPILLDLSLFGAKLHIWVSHRRLREIGTSRRKYLKNRFLPYFDP